MYLHTQLFLASFHEDIEFAFATILFVFQKY